MKLDDILNQPVGNLSSIITEECIPIKDVTIFSLIEKNGQPLLPGNGVYIFHDKKQFFYVGKSGSRCFVERIPSHFDLREKAWFNTLLRKLRDSNYGKNLYETANYAKNNLELTLIYLDDNQLTHCNKLEKLIRLCIKPLLNSYTQSNQEKFEKKITNDDTIKRALESL